MAAKRQVFNGKRYYLWNVSRTKGALLQQAKKIRKDGLLARVVAVPNKYAPKDVNYELYVYGSLRDLIGR